MVAFDANAYGETVAAILALDGGGQRLMPLANGTCSSEDARAILRNASATALFHGAHTPQVAMSGLFLYFSCLDEAHEIAQNVAGREGSFWHAIMHRQEPDAANSAYWFRQVGAHPVFPALRLAAAEVGVDFGPGWNPVAFIDYCEQARGAPGSDAARRALQVQRAEWQLLFDYCARPEKLLTSK